MRTGTGPAERVLVVTVRKAGTHLIREVVTAFGYTPYGSVATDDLAQPPLGRDVVWQLLQAVYLPAELDLLAASNERPVVEQAVREAVSAYLQAWEIRLGIRAMLPVPEIDAPVELVARALRSPAARDFAATPAGLCWFLHRFTPDRLDPAFVRQWAATGQPSVVYLYRDPRDVLLSMVDYLARPDAGTLGAMADIQAYAPVMRNAASTAQRLTLALTDPDFPGADEFARGLWLLRHPHVCAVSFEELVGPRGAGSAAVQASAVARLAAFLDVDVDVHAVAAGLFDPAARTFHQGLAGRWRRVFTPAHIKLFDERYGAIAEQYGYPG